MIENCNKILNDVYLIWEKNFKEALGNGSLFNVFFAMEIERDEVKLHSNLIAYLLNRKENHGLKTMFLELFINQLGLSVEYTLDDISRSIAYSEYNIGLINNDQTKGGRIDLLILIPGKKSILIENKIDAEDQPKQLIRYYNEFPNQDAHLFYLNLFGYPPSEKSIRNDDLKLVENVHFKIISYKSHIVSWLEDCLKSVSGKAYIHSTLKQYQNVLLEMTNQSINKKMEMEIANIATFSEANLTAVIAIKNSMNGVIANLKLILETQIKEKYMNEFEFDFSNWDKEYSRFSMTNDDCKKLGLKISFSFWNKNPCDTTDFFYGLQSINELVINNLDEFEEMRFNYPNKGIDKRFFFWDFVNPRYWDDDSLISIKSGEYVENTIGFALEKALAILNELKKKNVLVL